MNARVAEILSDQPAGFAQVASLAGDVEPVYHHVTQSVARHLAVQGQSQG
jgi:hypothetical protein